MDKASFVIISLFIRLFTCKPTVAIPETNHLPYRNRSYVSSDRYPDVSEYSISASGPFKKNALLTDLVKITEIDVITLDQTVLYATKVCLCHLKQLVDLVRQKWSNQYKVVILEAYASVNKTKFRPYSLHYEGRALDLSLDKHEMNTIQNRDFRNTQFFSNLMNDLAKVAYYEAKFTFSEIKQHHIHVSCGKYMTSCLSLDRRRRNKRNKHKQTNSHLVQKVQKLS